jgi:opacity protein-like surface antigen
MIKRFILLLLLVPVGIISNAQIVTSPYSIIGIGDIDSKDYGKFFGMSSTSIGVRSASFINLNNPASLTALEPNMLNLDFNVRWRSSQFKFKAGDTFTSSASDAQLQRFSLTFRPSKLWGFSFGFKPFSSVNYLLSERLYFSDGASTNILRKVDGSGGINQAYIANAFQLNKNFSVGLTTSFLFGTIKRTTTYTYLDLGSSITRNEYETLKGFQFQGGFQYTGKISANVKQTLGLTLTSPTTLKGSYTMNYVATDTTINSKEDDNQKFKIPLQFGAGYSLEMYNALTLAAEYRFSNWERAALNYPDAYTTRSQRFSLGFQYAPIKNIRGHVGEKYFIQAGVAYEQGYLQISNNQLNDMSATVGFGGNINRLLNLYIGVEVGSRGDNSKGQIREQYTQISAGITVKEFWFNTKKLKKYN